MEETQGTPRDHRPDRMTLADKLDLLLRAVTSEQGRPYSYAEVAAKIHELTGETISANAIWKLHKGQVDNPKKKTIEGLAAVFGVPPSYFFDEQTAHDVAEQLHLLRAMRESGVRGAQLRAFLDLSPESQALVADVIKHATLMDQQRQSPPEGDH